MQFFLFLKKKDSDKNYLYDDKINFMCSFIGR